ncbi:MAG: NfeD family protein [Lacipirellulaceae bacterium]
MNLFDEYSLAVLLTAIGCALIVAEVFFPSAGVIGTFAGLSLVAAIYFAFRYGGVPGGLGVAGFQVVAVPVLAYLAFQILPHTPMGRVLIGSAPTAAEVLPDDPRRALVGAVGIARSKLLPSGAVEIDGRMVDCVSQSQAIDPGEYVKVVEVRANRVMVRRAGADERPTRTVASTPEDPLARPADELGLEDFDLGEPSGRAPGGPVG